MQEMEDLPAGVRVLSFIHEGSFSSIVLGQRDGDAELSAIKIYRRTSDPEEVAKMVAERQTLQAATHPFLVTVVGIGPTAGIGPMLLLQSYA